MEPFEDFLNNAKSYGITPNFYRAEVLRDEIIYLPDRENYPEYWKNKDQEELARLKVKCSYKEGQNRVLDYMKENKVFLCVEEYALKQTYPGELQLAFIEEEIFEISRSELLVLIPYYNLMPFILNQYEREYDKVADPSILNRSGIIGGKLAQSQKGKFLLTLSNILEHERIYITPWQDYVEFLHRREFDIPQYAVPEY